MGSCLSKAGVFLDPKVEVLTVQLQSIGLSGVLVNCTLRATNPNGTALPLTRIVYLLKKKSDDTTLTEGVLNKNISIAPKDSTDIVVPMTFKYGGLGAVGKSLANRGATTVLVSGELSFDAPMTPSGTSVVPYKSQADIMLQ